MLEGSVSLVEVIVFMNAPVLLASSLTDVKPGLIIWTWVTFLIVLFLLRKVAWGPLLQAVEGREKNITTAIESAKRERAEAEKLLGEQKSAIAQARQEAAEAVRKTQGEMAKFRDRMKPVIDKHGAAIADTVKELQAELDKLRK